jgi:TonB family protein
MKKFLQIFVVVSLIALLHLFSIDCAGRTVVVVNDTVYYFTDRAAQYPGGQKLLSQYIARNLHYPSYARQIGQEARLFVRFVVCTDGTIDKVTVLNPTHSDLDDEALRLVRAMPKWEPAIRNNCRVKAYTTLPISFQL